MLFRVTPQTTLASATEYARLHGVRVNTLQQQISSGLRIVRPSIDPLGQRTLLEQQHVKSRLTTLQSNVESARSFLNQTEVQLRSAHDLFVQARTTVLQARQALDDNELNGHARQIDALIDRLVSIANTKHEGQYLFSGVDTRTVPFVESAASPGSFSYQGAGLAGSISLDNYQDVNVYAVGSDVFAPISRGTTIFVGTTGAAPGTGTDSAVGQSELIVRHALTTFSGASGIAAGTDSPDQDTVIGPAGQHTVTIDDTSGTGSFGTVSLNGGDPVNFTNGETNLQVTGPTGEILFVDTTAITPGFSGTVDVTATGTLSVDGGLTEVPINHTANQLVTDSTTGDVVNVDTTQVNTAGEELLELRGTSDAFSVLIELRDDILNARGLSVSDRQEALGRRIEDIDRIADHLLAVTGENAVNLQRLDHLQRRSEDLILEAERRLSEVGAADISEVVIRLQQEQSLLQFTLAATGRLFDTTLLNFLN